MDPDSLFESEGHMDLDEYQQAWHAAESQMRVKIDPDLLLKEVQRNQRNFRATIASRDRREVAIALLLVPVWIYLGLTTGSPWTWYLTVPALIWVAGYILVYRMRHKQDAIEPDEPLLPCVQRSLTEVEDQIWLLRNVFWWYLLPTATPMLAFTAHLSWLKTTDWLDAFGGVNTFTFVVFLAFFYFLYYINQRAVESNLEPRRGELLTLLASLGDESIGERTVMYREKSVRRSRKLRRWLIGSVSCVVTLVAMALAVGTFDSVYDQPVRSMGPAGEMLGKLIIDQRNEKNLVGLAAMIMVDGQVEGVAAYGERKKGSGVPLEIGDRWHLGGITKSITATMIATLVESDEMQWSDTLGEIFPQSSVHEDWKSVTLRQLLTHSAGARSNFSLQVRQKRPAFGPECTQARREAVLDVIAEKPAHPPGKKYAYSNVGLTIAGAMAEAVTGESWSDLVQREVFDALDLSESGFGPPKSPDKTLDQPQGHLAFLRGKVAVGDEADNTPIMGPAANVHMTLSDLCNYATEHLRGELGEGNLLSAETYQRLHTPEFQRYACGWLRQDADDKIPYTTYWHNGTNTMWYALVVFIPEKNIVIAVTSNDGDYNIAGEAAWEVVRECVRQICAADEPPEGVGFPRVSPFNAVRWQDSQPEVQLGDEWFRLVSLDEIPAEEIVEFSRRTYEAVWRKRFEEDLVELLTRMGNPPADKVTLVVQSLTSSETLVRAGVPMTKANRDGIREAALERAISDP